MAKLSVMHYHRNYSQSDVGGVEAYIRTVCENLQPKARFYVLADRRSGQKAHEYYPEAEVFRVNPQRREGRMISKVRDMITGELARQRQRAKILKQVDYDVLHVHGPVCYSNTVSTGPVFYPFYSRQAWLSTKKPVVMTFHGLAESILKEHYHNAALNPYFDLWKRIEKKNIERADKVIVVDKYAYDELCERPGIDQDKLEFVLNPIDTKLFRPITKARACEKLNSMLTVSLDPDVPTFCYTNRLTKDKGAEQLLRLIDGIHGRYQLLITGNGKYQRKIAEKARRNPKIKYLGAIPAEMLPYVVNASDFTFNPTLNAGALRVNMESIACHRPVITFDGGDRYPLVNGSTGIIYRDEDRLAQVVQDAINSNGLKVEGRKADYDRATKLFDSKGVCSRILKIYKQASE
ncbi:MAG: glycosyltransferase family 4 protein [Candidatus Micrarchaeia archaeon]